jgi:hypothetical protein
MAVWKYSFFQTRLSFSKAKVAPSIRQSVLIDLPLPTIKLNASKWKNRGKTDELILRLDP